MKDQRLVRWNRMAGIMMLTGAAFSGLIVIGATLRGGWHEFLPIGAYAAVLAVVGLGRYHWP